MPRTRSTAERKDPLTSLSHDLLAYVIGYLPERQFDAAARTHTSLRTVVQARPITEGCKRRIRDVATFKSHMSSTRRGLNLSGCLSREEPVRTQQLEVLRDWIRPGLIQLDLSANRLTSQEVNDLALQSDLTSLTSIDVGANRLAEEAALGLVRAIKPRDRMASFGLANCNIGPRGAEEIAKYVSSSRVLTFLNLSYNQLCGLNPFNGSGTYDPSGIQALASALGSAVLNKLVLSSNFIRDEGAIALGEGLKSNKTLKELELNHCGIGAEGGKALASALGMAVLTHLDLSTNKLTNDGQDMSGILAIAEALKSGTSVLTSINVEFNSLDEEAALGIVRAARQHDRITFLDLSSCKIGPTGAKEIAEYVSVTAVLDTLVLAVNKINDEGAIKLGEALKSNKTLKELDLYECGISAEGGKALASALEEAVLTHLDLSHNKIGVEGAKALANALKSGMAVLSTLSLYDNNIGPIGAKALADALASGRAVLKKLVLSENDIHDEGAIAIGKSLKTNSTLEELELSHCGIGAEGGKAIAVGLQAGIAALTSLKLTDNNLNAKAGKALASMLEVNRVLTKLDARFNTFGSEALSVLRDAAKGRKGFELLL